MTRQRARTVLLYAGIVPAVAALAFAALVLRFLAVQHAGNQAYDEGRFPAAADRYRSAGHLNPFEDWLAAFDAGAARHVEGQYAVAVGDYQAALRLGVPERDACTVRINLSLADEAIGDIASRAHRLGQANRAYRAGIDALEQGHCPTDAGRGKQQTKDGKAVDDRLRHKLQQNRKRAAQDKKKREQRQHQSKQQKQREQRQRERQRQQERQRENRLQQQNREGLRQRDQQQDQQGGGYQPNW